MARRWFSTVAGVAAIVGAGVGGCGPHRMLDPRERGPRADGAVIGVGVDGSSADGGVTPTPDAAAAPDGSAVGSRADARPSTDAGADIRPVTDAGADAATDAGGITTSPPVSACALSVGRLPAPPANAADIPGCGAAFATTDALSVGPTPAGQSYVRCRTIGPETSWRVTLSPDGRHLAARTSAGTVRLYDTDGWREIAQLASPVGMIDAAAFSPNGQALATLSGEMGRLTMWNVSDGSPARTFDAPALSTVGSPSSALAFSSDGRRIATSLQTVVDLLSDTTTNFGGQPAMPYSAPVNPAGNLDLSTTSMRFVGCDQRVLIESATPQGMLGWIGGLSLLDPVSGATTGLAGGIWAQIGAVVTSPDSRWIAFVQQGDTRRGLHLWDAAGATEVAFDPNPPRLVAGFSRAGDRLLVVTDTAIQVRHVPTLQLITQTALPAGTITAAAVSPRDQVILSTDSASMWTDPYTGVVSRRESFPIGGATFSNDGRFGVTDGSGATLFNLWSEIDPSVSCAPAASPPAAAVSGYALSQDAYTLAVVDTGGVVQVRGINTASQLQPPRATVETGLVAADGFNVAVAVDNGGHRVAAEGPVDGSGGFASRLVVIDTASGKPLLTREVPRTPGPLVLSPDGAWLAFQDGDYTGLSRATVLSVDTGATTVSVTGGQIDSFSPDSKRFAEAAGGMQIWDLASGNLVTTYSVPGAGVGYVALSPDWMRMAGLVVPTPTNWQTEFVAVWRAEDGTAVQQLGTQIDLQRAPRLDTWSANVATFLFGTHTLSTNWSAWHIWSVADGTELRAFAMSSSYDEPLALLSGGSGLLTRAGTGIAAWCR